MEDQRHSGNELPTRLREIHALASRFSKLIETANTGAHLVERTIISSYLDDVPKPCVAVDEDWLAMFRTVGSRLGELLHHGGWPPALLTNVPVNEQSALEAEWAKGGPQLVRAERFIRIANTLVSDFQEA